MTEKENTIESIHIQAKLWDTEEKAFWQQFKQTNGLTENSETLRAIVNQLRTLQSSPILKASLPDGCYRCDLNGVLTTNKKGELIVRCIERLENKQPITRDRFISEAETCSQKPTYIKLPTKEKYELAIQLLNGQLDREAENTDRLLREHDHYEGIKKESLLKDLDIEDLAKYQKEIEKQLKEAKQKLEPMETYITKNTKLSNWRLHTANYLLRVLEERDALETDNEQQRKTIEELSHDVLVETNKELSDRLEEAKQLLKVRENAKNDLIGEYKTEIEKVQALNEVRERKTTELISETRKMLTEFKQFLPSNLIQCQQCVDGTTMREYLRNIRKQINDFEGYLETTMPTPKDNLERYT
jgi:hypothetical protein